jgi:hypothetical protein
MHSSSAALPSNNQPSNLTKLTDIFGVNMPVITGNIDLDPEAAIEWGPVSEDHGPFLLKVSNDEGNPRIYLSYNVNPDEWELENLDDRGFLFGIETDYDDGSGNHKMEAYLQYQYISGRGGSPVTENTYRRPLMTQYDKVTNLPTVLYLGSGGNLGIQFCWNDGTGNVYEQQVVGKLKMQMNATNFDVWNQPGGTTKALSINSTVSGAVTGLELSTQAVTGGSHLKVTSTGTNEGLYLDAKGNAPVVFNQDGGGFLLIPDLGVSFTNDQDTGFYRAAANICGIKAGNTPLLTLNGSASARSTGVQITSAAAGSRAIISATSTGANEGLDIDAKGTGTIRIGSASSGEIILSQNTQAKKLTLNYAASGFGTTIKNTTDMTGTYSPDMILTEQGAAAASWYFAAYRSSAGTDNEFLFRGDGTALCDGSWNGGGADYAEYFEWADGNPKKQDRRGVSVVLTKAGTIRPATSKDKRSSIIGVISSRPAAVGDSAEMRWKDKYLRDKFGSEIEEEQIVLSWESSVDGKNVVKRFFSDRIPDGEKVPPLAVKSIEKRRKLNPAFDPTQTYIPRSQRSEWAPVGLIGKLVLKKGQPKGDRWIKLRDIDKAAELWLIR